MLKHCRVYGDGRIHGEVITNACISGRCSHKRPNMAQVPSVGHAFGAECRALFYAPDGWRLVGADASGLELRALELGSPTLIVVNTPGLLVQQTLTSTPTTQSYLESMMDKTKSAKQLVIFRSVSYIAYYTEAVLKRLVRLLYRRQQKINNIGKVKEPSIRFTLICQQLKNLKISSSNVSMSAAILEELTAEGYKFVLSTRHSTNYCKVLEL